MHEHIVTMELLSLIVVENERVVSSTLPSYSPVKGPCHTPVSQRCRLAATIKLTLRDMPASPLLA